MTLPSYLRVRPDAILLSIKVQPRASLNEIGQRLVGVEFIAHLRFGHLRLMQKIAVQSGDGHAHAMGVDHRLAAGALDTLAVAHSQAGDFDDALKFTQQAIELVDSKHTNLIAELEHRKTLYRSHQPYRTTYVPDDRPVKALLDTESTPH